MTGETRNLGTNTEVEENSCCAAKPEGNGQINLFGEAVSSPKKKKDEKKKDKAKTASVNRLSEASDKEFEEAEKTTIVYSGREIAIQPEDALAGKKEIWEKYLRQFPEFNAESSFKYIQFCLGKEDDMKGQVRPIFMAGPKG